MQALTVRLPQVKGQPEGRPKGCPHCPSSYLHRHGS